MIRLEDIFLTGIVRSQTKSSKKRNSKIQRLWYSTEFDMKLDFEVGFAESNLLQRTYLGGDMIQKDF